VSKSALYATLNPTPTAMDIDASLIPFIEQIRNLINKQKDMSSGDEQTILLELISENHSKKRKKGTYIKTKKKLKPIFKISISENKIK